MQTTDADPFPPGEIDPRRAYTAIGLLSDGAWWSLADLVRETGAPRRSVEALLRHLGAEKSARGHRLPAATVDRLAAVLRDRPRPLAAAGPVDHLLDAHADAVARLDELIRSAPRARQELDHVSATPETVVRRALLLGARFWLHEARLLCVGDHDLTSLAVALLFPEVEVTVVDIDDQILEHIDRGAAALGVPVRTRWADLRIALPPSAAQRADFAITDPPYTPDGIALFTARAFEGLRDPGAGRILLAYGAGDRTPTLALKVQNALAALNLATEAVYPDFNRYYGAEAIGSAADLYVLRPTSRTAPAVSALSERTGAAAIYTHGPQSVEARAQEAASPGKLLDDGFQPSVLVGGWPADLLPKLPRARLRTWLAKPYASSPKEVAIALPPGQEAVLPRLLLASRAARIRVLASADPAEVGAAVGAVYDVTARDGFLEAVRRPVPAEPAAALTRTIMDRAHGKLLNTWREGLTSARSGLSKRQAAAVVLAAAPWAEGVTPLELPAHHLAALPEAVAATLAADAPAGPDA
ncbi:bis-aminopropyl spermidine synthase family protein [Spirillospora sp. NPDC050679]